MTCKTRRLRSTPFWPRSKASFSSSLDRSRTSSNTVAAVRSPICSGQNGLTILSRALSSRMMFTHSSTHSSQMKIVGPAINLLADFVLALAAEGAVQRFRLCRFLCTGLPLGRLDFGGQDIPVGIPERVGDQLKGFAVSDFDGLRLQRIA